MKYSEGNEFSRAEVKVFYDFCFGITVMPSFKAKLNY